MQRRELEYLSRRMNSAEINGSFYSLQRPERYRTWSEQTPDDFVFAVKGGRFITHMRQLRDVETPLANFFASGVLALGHKLGPVLWQLPERLRFDPDRLADFFDLLPRTTRQASALAKRHDDKLKADPYTSPGPNRTIRHALEIRHPSFVDTRFTELLRAHHIALVVADTAGRWPYLEDVTADFAYIRLHGAEQLYTGGYSAAALDDWASKISGWSRGADVYAYFDNDIGAHAPFDAMALAERLGVRPSN